jgi:hypothetical protein
MEIPSFGTTDANLCGFNAIVMVFLLPPPLYYTLSMHEKSVLV